MKWRHATDTVVIALLRGIVMAFLVLTLFALYAAVVRGDDLCYLDPHGVEWHVAPTSLEGQTAGATGGAHDICMYDARGICDPIGSECTPGHTENSYARPPAAAGAIVLATWDYFHTDPDAEAHRCNVALPAGIKFKPVFDRGMWPPKKPTAGWPACPKSGHGLLGCVPFTIRAGVWDPVVYTCGSKTPIPTARVSPTVHVTAITPKRTNTPTGGCCPAGIPCPKGVPPCVPPAVTRTTQKPTVAPPTRPIPATATPARTTPAPAPTVRPTLMPPTAAPPTLTVSPNASSSPTSGGTGGSSNVVWIILVAAAGAVVYFIRSLLTKGDR